MQEQLYFAKKKLRQSRKITLNIPSGFSFNRGDSKNFNPVINFFKWDIKDCPVEIDFTGCSSANYQALSLIIPYCWHLKQNRCTISFKLDNKGDQSSSQMWRLMGSLGLFSVSTDHTINFKGYSKEKPLFAIRNSTDFKEALDAANEFSGKFGIEYQKTLRYVLAELLYNALEHGKKDFHYRSRRLLTPAILQYSWYERANEICIIVADIGVGIHSHLAQAYPGISSNEEALRLAIQPEISGTFGRHDPYTNRNNAGMGLFLSSNIIRKLRADMHIVSGDTVLHISPNDLTSRQLENKWHGTFVLITMKLDQGNIFALDQLMQELREKAESEVKSRISQQKDQRHYLEIFNYFGRNADDKQAAISYRDKYLLKAIEEGKVLVLDFGNVDSSPHSFLNALLASPIRRLGMQAYKKIKITRATPEIRETLDYVLDDNTSPEGVNQAKYDD